MRKNWYAGRWFLGKNGKIEEGRWTGKEVDLWYFCDEGDDQWTDVTEAMINALVAEKFASKRKKTPDSVTLPIPDGWAHDHVPTTRNGATRMGRGRTTTGGTCERIGR